jgi:hypothetical protein
MKRVTASEARKNWFRLLDEVAAGEVVVLERKGRRLVLRLEEPPEKRPVPDYSQLIQVVGDELEDWTWEWTGPGEELRLIERPKE